MHRNGCLAHAVTNKKKEERKPQMTPKICKASGKPTRQGHHEDISWRKTLTTKPCLS